VVEARREVGDNVSVERRHFLCSIAPDAKNFARAVREHWGIENCLHWVLDVSLQEDQSRARTRYAAQNLALLRKLVLNLVRKDTSRKKKSLRSRRNIAAWSISYLETLLKLPI
jgi:predicted transposase YbfD/YdcC